jgi:hypothetical protein
MANGRKRDNSSIAKQTQPPVKKAKGQPTQQQDNLEIDAEEQQSPKPTTINALQPLTFPTSATITSSASPTTTSAAFIPPEKNRNTNPNNAHTINVPSCQIVTPTSSSSTSKRITPSVLFLLIFLSFGSTQSNSKPLLLTQISKEDQMMLGIKKLVGLTTQLVSTMDSLVHKIDQF